MAGKQKFLQEFSDALQRSPAKARALVAPDTGTTDDKKRRTLTALGDVLDLHQTLTGPQRAPLNDQGLQARLAEIVSQTKSNPQIMEVLVKAHLGNSQNKWIQTACQSAHSQMTQGDISRLNIGGSPRPVSAHQISRGSSAEKPTGASPGSSQASTPAVSPSVPRPEDEGVDTTPQQALQNIRELATASLSQDRPDNAAKFTDLDLALLAETGALIANVFCDPTFDSPDIKEVLSTVFGSGITVKLSQEPDPLPLSRAISRYSTVVVAAVREAKCPVQQDGLTTLNNMIREKEALVAPAGRSARSATTPAEESLADMRTLRGDLNSLAKKQDTSQQQDTSPKMGR